MLEGLLYIPSFVLFIIIILTPFFVHRTSKKFKIRNIYAIPFINLFFSLVISFILFTLLVYWMDDLSKNILLNFYGFDFYANDYNNVKPENLQTVNEIRNSMMGIGWTLKAIAFYLLLVLPYNLAISIILGYFIIQGKNKN